MLIPSDHLPSPVALTDAPPASTAATPASLTQMAAILGHEIRTPMNAMIGVLSLLLETNLDDEQRDYVMTVRSASDAMLTVINDFLDMARIDAGRLRLEAIPFDLRTTVEELVHLFAGQAAARGLELNHIVHHDVPPLLVGDPGRLRQVLANLISNAIKFTEHGEVTVRVRALKTGGDHARIRIDVSDTGIGMTEAELRDLFQPYFQGDGSIFRRFGGSGLGLSICRQLCDLMGGGIEVESAPGRGSTFRVDVTLKLADEPDECQSVGGLAALCGWRVLIVESNDACREHLTQIMESWKLSVQSVGHGVEALEMLRAAPGCCDLLLLSQELDDMEGLDLVARLRREPEPHPAVILLAGIGQRGQCETARLHGVRGYLTKPVRCRQLLECLLLVLQPQDAATSTRLVTRHTLAEQKARNRPRVLLVEDNPLNQKIGIKLLETLGCRTDVAPDGEEAVRAVRRYPYQLVLMDCHLPRMGGKEATRAIRQREAEHGGQRVPIIALTGSSSHCDRQGCVDAGMDDYLVKPVRLATLRRLLQRFVPGVRLTENATNSEPEKAVMQ